VPAVIGGHCYLQSFQITKITSAKFGNYAKTRYLCSAGDKKSGVATLWRKREPPACIFSSLTQNFNAHAL
jgi:hypothetical protein